MANGPLVVMESVRVATHMAHVRLQAELSYPRKLLHCEICQTGLIPHYLASVNAAGRIFVKRMDG